MWETYWGPDATAALDAGGHIDHDAVPVKSVTTEAFLLLAAVGISPDEAWWPAD